MPSEFRQALQERNIMIDDGMMAQFDHYARFLSAYNEKINLTAITAYDEVFDKHFYDSLLCADGQLAGSLVDVGSGAGFPGVVLKIAFPELKVILVEPIRKRCVFLNELITELGLQDIEVVNSRGEDYSLLHREAYDYVTARAVSSLPILIEVCGAMVRKDGAFIAMRGKEGRREIAEAETAISRMGFTVESIRDEELLCQDKRVIACLRKERPSPIKFPRKYNIIKKNPL